MNRLLLWCLSTLAVAGFYIYYIQFQQDIRIESNLIPQNIYHFNATDRVGFYSDVYGVYQCRKFLHKSPGKLPSFFVAGVHKGGSTALYGYLVKHGLVRPASCKETHFFTRDAKWKMGLHFYRRHFPPFVSGVISGEGSPDYIRSPIAVIRIALTIPDSKILFALRDPVERFISHYVGFDDRDLTDLSCNAFWKESMAELNSCVEGYLPERHKTIPTESQHSSLAALRLAEFGELLPSESPSCRSDTCIQRYCLTLHAENPIARSVYADQIARWLLYFPSSQLLPIRSESLFKHTNQQMQVVANFLGIREFNPSELEAFNFTEHGSEHHSNPLSNTCDRNMMSEYFLDENKHLYNILKKQWSHLSWPHW